MKKTKKMLSFVLSMLLIVTMFPTMAFAKEEAKTWKFGELSLKAGDVLGKDTEIKNDAENREIRILSEKTNPDEKKDQKDDKERIKTEKEAVIAAAASWNLKDLTEKAKKAPADYLLKKADSWNGSWIVTKIAETETKDAIEIQIRTYEYAAVTEIQGIPKEIPGTTALTGKAVPENADQKQITWEITDAGITGAVLDGTNLKVTNAGTVKLLATIKDGKKTGVDFTQEFTVIVKAADYTKVTEALALIPEDMGRYTEESAAAVQKAKDAVKENLPSAEQETVNGYAAAIQTAVNALTLLGADYTEVDAVSTCQSSGRSFYLYGRERGSTECSHCIHRPHQNDRRAAGSCCLCGSTGECNCSTGTQTGSGRLSGSGRTPGKDSERLIHLYRKECKSTECGKRSHCMGSG